MGVIRLILRMIWELAQKKGVNEFDFPDYAGLGELIIEVLTPDFVDLVQQCWFYAKTMDRDTWVDYVVVYGKEIGYGLDIS